MAVAAALAAASVDQCRPNFESATRADPTAPAQRIWREKTRLAASLLCRQGGEGLSDSNRETSRCESVVVLRFAAYVLIAFSISREIERSQFSS